MSEVRWRFTLCVSILFLRVRFRFLSGHILGNSCSLGWLYVLFVVWLIVISVISRFDFKGWIWVLIASVPDLCIHFTFYEVVLMCTHNLFLRKNKKNLSVCNWNLSFLQSWKFAIYCIGMLSKGNSYQSILIKINNNLRKDWKLCLPWSQPVALVQSTAPLLHTQVLHPSVAEKTAPWL